MEDSGIDVLLKTLLLLLSCLCASSSLSHLYEYPRYLSWAWQTQECAKYIARASHKVTSPDGGKKNTVVEKYFLSLQHDLYQKLANVIFVLYKPVSWAMWVLKVMVNDLHQKSCSSKSSHEGHGHAVRISLCYSSRYTELDCQWRFVSKGERCWWSIPMSLLWRSFLSADLIEKRLEYRFKTDKQSQTTGFEIPHFLAFLLQEVLLTQCSRDWDLMYFPERRAGVC